MSPSDPDSPSRRRLSALADGEAAEGECVEVFSDWRADADVRATWHAYHLIGDVLRSEDLVSPAQRGCSLLQQVRARLAQEPVVLAPVESVETVAQGVRTGTDRAAVARPRWQAPAAMAAGFLAVIVGVQVARAPRGVDVASAGAGAPGGVVTAARSVPATAPRPDQVLPYVTVHRLSTMDALLTMPGQMSAGELRNASIVQTGR